MKMDARIDYLGSHLAMKFIKHINGFRPAGWAAAGSSALGVIAAALAPAKSASADRVTLAPEPAHAGQPV